MKSALTGRSLQGARTALITLGCQMNVHDGLRLREQLVGQGLVICDEPDTADAVIVLTCSVRPKAEQKALSILGRIRARGPQRPLIVLAGCMAQVHGRELLAAVPYADVVVGPNDYYRLAELIALASQGRRQVAVGAPDPEHDFPAARGGGGAVCAFVTAMKGCNNYCTYCVVPYARGPERSRPAADIVAEVGRLAAQGVREVTLLGQNVNSYAPQDDHVDFAELLARVGTVPGIARVRFMTSHPKDMPDRLIAAFAEVPTLCEHVHLPVQAGSDRVLAAMGRGYTAAHYLGIVERLRARVAGVHLTTDVMVGFPGESTADFAATLELMTRARFDDCFAFIYSPRPHAASGTLADDVPYAEKVARLTEVIALQAETTRRSMQAAVGTRAEVLIEGPSREDPAMLTGRTRTNVVVHLPEAAAAGTLAVAYVARAGTHSLYASLTEAGRGAGTAAGDRAAAWGAPTPC